MAKKHTPQSSSKRQPAGKAGNTQARKPNFKNLLINYILLTAAFYFGMKSCQKDKIKEKEQAKTEQTASADSLARISPPARTDSVTLARLQSQAGDWAKALTVAPQPPFTVENEVMKMVFSPRGGTIRYLELKKYPDPRGGNVVLIDSTNQDFHLDIPLPSGKVLSTADLNFVPQIQKTDSLTVVRMTLPAGEKHFLAFEYRIPRDDYMIDFKITGKKLPDPAGKHAIPLHWDLKARAHEKGPKYENQFTALKYAYDDDKTNDLSAFGSKKEKDVENVRWVDFKQWFFSSFLLSTDKPWKKAHLKQVKLFDEEKDSLHTKHFFLDTRLETQNGNLDYHMQWYHGPNDYHLLVAHDHQMDKVIRLGWTIFGWINKYAFIPLFDFLKKFISNYGLIIILMTLIVRLVTSPLYYKTYVSQAKTKIIKPEMDEINRKYKDNPMKRQKEIMALQSKAGVNPLSGCVPSLLFLPIFYALFRFFPAEIDLRGKGFLWIDDLSAYESVMKFPFHIPLLGNHLSLFALLAAVVMYFYMKMNQSGQATSMPTQEGMPDMSKMMKWMLYLSPVMMFVFFNNYASGLSLYYFVSTLLSLIIVYVIKEFVIDEEKVKARIEENKKKPKKQSRFQERLQRMMEEAERQKEMQRRAKRKK